MKQVTQYQKTGVLSVEELAAPKVRPGTVLVRTAASLISAGTERTSVETAQASYLGKARSRPDLLKQVLDGVRKEGVAATWNRVQTRLDTYKELGYSSAGIVVASGTPDFQPGDRVALGGSTANHAELVVVPRNLAVRVPDDVSLEEASFGTLGAIALQGVRQAEVRLGEVCVVVGLGLIGLLTVQLLKANGCRVIGIDLHAGHFDLARRLGADLCLTTGDENIRDVQSFSRGWGADAVLLCASTTSDEPMERALHFARKRGRVVVVGAVGMNLPRSPFYEKELEIRISCSYGPGRYDPEYEDAGVDYPYAYVRWTEQRNIEAVLDLLGAKRLDVRSLISHRIPIADALEAYALLTGDRVEPYLGIVLQYPERDGIERQQRIPHAAAVKASTGTFGFIGAGNFATATLLPPLQQAGAALGGVVTGRPVNAASAARKFGFSFSSTDAAEVLADPTCGAVVIATRHDSHARYIVNALSAGKHVFVEKPLAVDSAQLAQIVQARNATPDRALLVGFNRRFSEPFRAIWRFFAGRSEPLSIVYRVNAGPLPATHWVNAPEQGGRIIGEACHFVDILQYLTGARPLRVTAAAARMPGRGTDDIASFTIDFSDGSIGTVHYIAHGSPKLAKEYCEVHGGERSAVMENFQRVELHGARRSETLRFDGTKGHREEMRHFLDLVRGRDTPVLSFASMVDTTRVTFAVLESLRTGAPISLETEVE